MDNELPKYSPNMAERRTFVKESVTLKKKYGKGYDLIKRMGFSGGGLGIDGSGMTEPLTVNIRSKNQGLGILEGSNLHLGSDTPNKTSNTDNQTNIKRVKLVDISTDTKDIDDISQFDDIDICNCSIFSDTSRALCDIKKQLSNENDHLKNLLFETEEQLKNCLNDYNKLTNRLSILREVEVMTKSLYEIFKCLEHEMVLIEEYYFTADSLFTNNNSERIELSMEDHVKFLKSFENSILNFNKSCKSYFENYKDSICLKVTMSYLPFFNIIECILLSNLEKIYTKFWKPSITPNYGVELWHEIYSIFQLLNSEKYDSGEYVSNYDSLVTNTVGQGLKQYFMSWDPINCSEVGLSVLEIWSNLLPRDFINNKLLNGIIWKRHYEQLQIEYTEKRDLEYNIYDYIKKNNIEYKWLLLWLPLYNETGMATTVAKAIMNRISEILKTWKPPDLWPIYMLKIWRPILEVPEINQEMDCILDSSFNEFEKLMSNSIYPKLQTYLNESLDISIEIQINDSCIQYILTWFENEILSINTFVQLYAECIGPKWINCLLQTLKEVRKYSYLEQANIHKRKSLWLKIYEWYKYWKMNIPKQVLSSSIVKTFLIKGMILIDFHLNKYSELSSSDKSKTYRWIDHKDTYIPFIFEMSKAEQSNIILRNTLEWVCGECGLSFKPRIGKMVNGKQIFCMEYIDYYKLITTNNSMYFNIKPEKNKVLFYIHDGVPFYFDSSNSKDDLKLDKEWKPLAACDLLSQLGITLKR
ncbi:G-patch domain-containing protein [Cryptosporidium muris RN66]|uniref:G-patch domain-containing protein n=1 Tax=Cryptosporidium muris (strain RN66) TaxID=441375 RepID=B6AJP7_CRYMR|nr:G-patch domain-containing protein [Cryptosporidium muris RN66]EEA08438.1 G-patch domain-containing protein [Cryptosporidium muris RN66]|eukprot:XP_002142787.1 G-patch domain-containing protein [Cryptosporidium muris RN66]